MLIQKYFIWYNLKYKYVILIFIPTMWEGKNMINYYDLSTEKNTNRISVSLVFKRVLKCTLIIMPTLLFSSVASAKDVVKIVKTSKKLSKSEKALLIVIKTSGLYIGR